MTLDDAATRIEALLDQVSVANDRQLELAAVDGVAADVIREAMQWYRAEVALACTAALGPMWGTRSLGLEPVNGRGALAGMSDSSPRALRVRAPTLDRLRTWLLDPATWDVH